MAAGTIGGASGGSGSIANSSTLVRLDEVRYELLLELRDRETVKTRLYPPRASRVASE